MGLENTKAGQRLKLPPIPVVAPRAHRGPRGLIGSFIWAFGPKPTPNLDPGPNFEPGGRIRNHFWARDPNLGSQIWDPKFGIPNLPRPWPWPWPWPWPQVNRVALSTFFFFFENWPPGPKRGPNWAQNQVFGPILSPGPNVRPWDPKPKRCGPKNHAKPRLQNSKWCHMVQVMAKNHFDQFWGPFSEQKWPNC